MFVWKPSDMPGVPRDKIEHELKIKEGAKPIKQRLRWFTTERKAIIKIEITKLLAAGFIKEVYHLLAFLMPNRICIPQAHRITAVALHLGVFQGIVNILREAIWIKSIEESNDELYYRYQPTNLVGVSLIR